MDDAGIQVLQTFELDTRCILIRFRCLLRWRFFQVLG
jgi:hypothetical protein